ncbi:replicative DNA helicase [Candidatus Borreliella tachyglossi]|uniref:replicative DNA helicase n=1 Tax=Candidatus Borreliella tachyglossi TaxID=1964448 RepID=UPI0040425B22
MRGAGAVKLGKEFANLYNDAAERAVLSAVLLSSDCIEELIGTLESKDFYLQGHRLIYDAMLDLHLREAPITPITVYARIMEAGAEARRGALRFDFNEYLNLLSTLMPTTKTVLTYAKIVKGMSLRRLLLMYVQDISAALREPATDLEELIEGVQAKVTNLDAAGTKHDAHLLDVGLAECSREINFSKSGCSASGVKTGYKDLDFILGVIKNGDFVVVGARPSIGKTAFGVNVATHLAISENKSVLFFSLEMQMLSVVKRILSSYSGVDSYKICNTHLLTPSEVATLERTMRELEGSKLYINDDPCITLSSIIARSRKMQRLHNLDMVVIDYLGLIGSEDRGQPRHEQMAHISRTLKALSKTLSVPIIALSQLTRDSEGREPTLASLRESGAIEQDADVVLLMHRDRDYSKHRAYNEPLETKITVAKNRNGRIGVAKLMFAPHLVKFKDKDRDV